MKSKFGIVLIILTMFLLPNKTLSQNINFELKNIVPEELRILKEEYKINSNVLYNYADEDSNDFSEVKLNEFNKLDKKYKK